MLIGTDMFVILSMRHALARFLTASSPTQSSQLPYISSRFRSVTIVSDTHFHKIPNGTESRALRSILRFWFPWYEETKPCQGSICEYIAIPVFPSGPNSGIITNPKRRLLRFQYPGKLSKKTVVGIGLDHSQKLRNGLHLRTWLIPLPLQIPPHPIRFSVIGFLTYAALANGCLIFCDASMK